jgi:crotonobetainyl-CoA:carnitine CoA-transferase CaiB-like acyl-CoA transferase
MLDAITTFQMQEISVFTVGGKPQERSAEPHAHVYIRSPYGSFQTADGFIIISFPPLEKFGELIGEPAFKGLKDEVDGWTQRDMIFAKTRERIRTRSSTEWLALFRENDIWAGPVYGYADLVNDPQIVHNGTFVEYDHPTEGRVKTPGFPIRFSATPSSVRRGAPLAGEHSREVLREFGFSEERIQQLVDSGAVFAGNAP